MEKSGYIYVLTNESFHKDNWIKIGYADNVEKRVKELSGTAVPLPYEVYCTYEIPKIQGEKDPDKLIHDLIQNLNPNLRISPNREFFEIFPWDAYDMLLSLARLHGRADKLKRNEENDSGSAEADVSEYSVVALFPDGSDEKKLYERIKGVIYSISPKLKETPLKNYVTYKNGKSNIVSLWPKAGWIEVILNAKLGTIKDENEIVYDISNRRWTSAQYAFRYYPDTDDEIVKNLLNQVVSLKN